jgi:hypothetical protein
VPVPAAPGCLCARGLGGAGGRDKDRGRAAWVLLLGVGGSGWVVLFGSFDRAGAGLSNGGNFRAW